MTLSQLSAPFDPAAIHWRAQTLTSDGNKALALAYLNARDVMDRLDDVVGPENWQDSYTETPKGRTICTLSIRVNGEWISKSDGAGDTDVEGDKGSISDALKRAAVKWGIGRYLYALGNVWAPCETYAANGKKRWSKWLPQADKIFADALARLATNNNQLVRDDPPEKPDPDDFITDATRDYLAGLIDKHSIPVGAACKQFTVMSLKELKYKQVNAFKAWVEEQRKAA